MRKTNKIIVLMSIIAIMVLTLTGCETKTNLKTIDKKELTEYTEYTDESGIKFSYPKDWSDIGSGDKKIFVDANTGTNVNLVSENIQSTYNLKTYVTASIKNIKYAKVSVSILNSKNIKETIGSNIKGDIAEEEVKLNGRDAYIISYTMTQNDVEFEIKQAIFIDSKTAYVLTTTVPGELKDENSETIDNIISSFMKYNI